MVFVGYGILGDYSSEVSLIGPATVSAVMDMIGLPKDLRAAVTVIKNGRAAVDENTVENDDHIHILIMLDGG